MIHGSRYYMTFDDLPRVVERTVKGLQRTNKRFDSIVVRGVSGLVVGGPVALALEKPLLVVRKPQERSHASEHKVINRKRAGKDVLFLDDFYDTGATLFHTREQLRRSCPEARIQWMYAYDPWPDRCHWYKAKDVLDRYTEGRRREVFVVNNDAEGTSEGREET